VPLGRPTAEEAVAVLQSAATGDRHPRPQRDDAAPQRHRGHGQLPGGSRRIARLDGAVEQGVGLAHVEAAPVIRVYAAHEGVGIETGRAVQGEDLARIGVQREHRAALSRREDLCDVALQLEVDRGVQRAARHRRQPGGGARLAHDAVERAHLHEPHTVCTAQRVVVLALEPALPQQAPEPHRREAPLRPLGFGELTDVAHQVGHQRAVRVVPPRLRLDQESGEDQPPLLERRHDRERGAREHRDR